MTEKKFLDCRISWKEGSIDWTIRDIVKELNKNSALLVKVTPLPELASELELRNTFLNLAERVSVPDKINTNCWRWAWIIDYYDLAKALLGKVALPSPEPVKDCKCENPMDVQSDYCDTCGKLVIPQREKNCDYYLCGKCLINSGTKKAWTTACKGLCKNWIPAPKPPEKKELPEKFFEIDFLEIPGTKEVTQCMIKINLILDIIREMREGKG